ncbi:MAG: 5'-methylthioadenosine/S-adenosylhomocysteine nucleosidase [Chloroflexi bacterium]|nr:5'-methylthioadenosine/S-adenosylhomocysteine nucleosidase [Chloroflexota bacterium]
MTRPSSHWRIPAAVLLILMMVGVAQPAPTARDLLPRVGIAAVSAAEMEPLAAGLSDVEWLLAGGVPYTIGTVDGRLVVLFQAGPGMVNAAARIQHALDRFAITHLIFSGAAGALEPGLAPGQVVVPRWWVNHQFGVFTDDGIQPLPLHIYPAGGEPLQVDGFEVDPELYAIAERIDGVRAGGTGVSGDQFIRSDAARGDLASRFAARIVDMESAAAAQVALLNDVPFIAVRAISDDAGDMADGQIEAQIVQAGRAAAAATLELVRLLP